MSRSRLAFLACVAIGTLVPTIASAHVKWFVDPAAYPLRTDLIVSDRTAAALAVCALVFLSLTQLERWFRGWRLPAMSIVRGMARGAPTIFAVQAAIALVASAAQGRLLAPNIVLPDGALGAVLVACQLAIAFTFVTGLADWIGALVLIVLVLLTSIVGHVTDPLEQFFWVGIAAVVLMIGRGSTTGRGVRPWFRAHVRSCRHLPMSILRVSTGLAIIAVAFTEKVWNPDIGRALLASYPSFNVVHSLLGLSWFSDDQFVLLAGLVEIAIGAALLSGKLTRLVVLGMWLPFNVGVLLLPSQELLGHLPLFGIMYMLLVVSDPVRTKVRNQVRQVAPAVAVRPYAWASTGPVAAAE
jgi:hypothetical protein